MKTSCYRHSDRPATYYCQKDGKYMCAECACCHSPRIYCQFRTACIIDMLTREGELLECQDKVFGKGALPDTGSLSEK